jgi:hypothetical protein
MARFIDISGRRFGRVVVTKRMPSDGGRSVWEYRCDCGTIKSAHYGSLKDGLVRSCGCLRAEFAKRAKWKKHGKNKTPEHRIWIQMNYRCRTHKNYAGRGIRVCRRWLKFENFLADMGVRPTPHHTLERRNNSGPYSPSNCEWATMKAQQNNKRNSRVITAFGKTQSATEWAHETGIKRSTIYMRFFKQGRSAEDALTSPVRKF